MIVYLADYIIARIMKHHLNPISSSNMFRKRVGSCLGNGLRFSNCASRIVAARSLRAHQFLSSESSRTLTLLGKWREILDGSIRSQVHLDDRPSGCCLEQQSIVLKIARRPESFLNLVHSIRIIFIALIYKPAWLMMRLAC